MLALLTTLVLGASLAGCATSSAPAPHPSPSTSTRVPPRGRPSLTHVKGVSGPQPHGRCAFVSRHQVRTAISSPIQHVGACTFRFAQGLGLINVITWAFRSPAQARACMAGYERGPGLRVIPIAGLGHAADLAGRPGPGKDAVKPGSSQDIALLTRDARMLGVVILWGRHPARSGAAITLLRDAVANLGAPVPAAHTLC